MRSVSRYYHWWNRVIGRESLQKLQHLVNIPNAIIFMSRGFLFKGPFEETTNNWVLAYRDFVNHNNTG